MKLTPSKKLTEGERDVQVFIKVILNVRLNRHRAIPNLQFLIG